MDTVSNITTAASKALWGEGGEETAHNETGGKEPVSGQMGNVAAGEPYDRGNLDTPKTETVPTLGAAGGISSTQTSAETATNGKAGLYNPILPATPGETGASDYTSSARHVSGIGADSPNGKPASPTLQYVVNSEQAPGSATKAAQKNGVTSESREEARKSSDQSVTYATRPGGRRKSRQSSGPKPVDRVDLALRSVSREHERKASQRNALAPLAKTVSARRRAASASAEDDLDDRVGASVVTDSPVVKERKMSLKDRIKAKFQKK